MRKHYLYYKMKRSTIKDWLGWTIKIKPTDDPNILRIKGRDVLAATKFRLPKNRIVDTYAPTVRSSVIKFLLMLCVQFDFTMKQGDIISAFPRADAHPNTYCFIPKELSGKTYDMYRLVTKALYGLPEAAHLFNKWLNTKLINLNYIRSLMDPCIYYKSTTDYFVILSTHVDNIGIFFKNITISSTIDIVINELKNNLPFTDEGDLHNYLNVNIIYDNIKGI